MTTGATRTDLDYHGSHLPRGSFARSLFDNQLIRMSDRGGASQLIGDAWSEVVARELEDWVGVAIPSERPALASSRVAAVHRLDTMPGVAARASKIGLKNPDFVVFALREGHPLIVAVDAKFLVETARAEQVSAETMRLLFEHDPHLIELLPDRDPEARYADGLFLAPDYSLTHAMFQRKVGHRRMTVSPHDVVLTDVGAREMFGRAASEAVMDRLIAIDDAAFPVWESLLAAQYYFRLERAVAGLDVESRKPLLGAAEIVVSEDALLTQIGERALGVSSAWELVLEWDRDVEIVRRQRQALHQVIGSPLSSAELRELSDDLLDRLEIEPRPSRNRVRKALGARFTADVLALVDVIEPPVADFSTELQRVAEVAREVGSRYESDIREIVGQIILDLAGEGQVAE
ncbi:MAG TPA: hypothetical protein VGR22_09760 [Thermomicrobiales bacterium]|nr:hypothetical protein [Thermomicrobiales bacterium]